MSTPLELHLLNRLRHPYYAHAYRSAAFTSVAATWANMPFDVETADYNGNFTIGATSYYTCPVAGRYLVTGRLGWAATASLRAITAIYQTGAEVSRGVDLTNFTVAQPTCHEVQDIILCNAGDTMSIWYYTSAIVALENGSIGATMSIQFLAPA